MMSKYVLLCALVASVASLGTQTEVIVSGVRFSREVTEYGTVYTSDDARYIVSSQQRNWVNATSACNAQSSRLVSLESSRKNDIIKNLLLSGGHSGRHWSSGVLSYGGLWVWSSTGQPLTYDFSAWAPDEPNHGTLMDDCLYLDPDYGWFDNDCLYALNYVCE